MKKKIMAIVLSVLCLTMILPVTAFADEVEVQGAFEDVQTITVEDATIPEVGRAITLAGAKITFTPDASAKIESVAFYKYDKSTGERTPYNGDIEEGYDYGADYYIIPTISKNYRFTSDTQVVLSETFKSKASCTVDESKKTETHREDQFIVLQIVFKPTVETYTVAFDADGGTPEPEAQVVESGGKVLKPETDPVKEGFTFLGWYRLEDGLWVFWEFDRDTVGEDVTLKALWEEQTTYTVTFDANGGTPEPEAQVVAEHGKVTKPADPTKEGYVFDAWYPESGGAPWDFEKDLVINNTKLVASWKEKAADIEFTVELSQTEFTYDGNAHVPTVTVKDKDGNVLTEGKDYRVSIAGGEVAKQINVGTVEIIVYSEVEGYKDTTATYKIVEASNVPKTGDANNSWLYVLAGALALGAMGTVVLRKKADR